MSAVNVESGLAPVNGALLYYEVAGEGPGLVMIHAGVADNRQWNNEFAHFAQSHRVLRYDMRGYGKSEPVAGDYRRMDDLTGLLDHLHFPQPAILMGCSMGGMMAMDLALAEPQRVRALIMVGSGPDYLDLGIGDPDELAEAEVAFKAGDLDRAAEIETQVWFDGIGRPPERINPDMRKLAYEMNRLAVSHYAKGLGKTLRNLETPAAGRLAEIKIPVLAVVGSYDIEYVKAAADYMVEHMPAARKALIEDAAHLPNMDPWTIPINSARLSRTS
jgi:pimeloyl-ACP methyl ester carboxylesterase